MITVEVPAKLTPDDLFVAMSQLPSPELNRLIERVLTLQAQRDDGGEGGLLTIINRRLSPAQQSRLEKLRTKNQLETLDVAERTELQQFIKQVEQHEVERMEALVKLSQKRGVSLPQLMIDLGIEAQYA